MFRFKIIDHLVTLNEGSSVRKEVNIVQWGNGEPKLDIRKWTEDPGSDDLTPGKGISLTEDEGHRLLEILSRFYLKED